MSLANVIRMYMKQRKIGSKELSEKSGVPLRTVSNIIGGKTKNPTLDSVKALAMALNCTLDDFADNMKTINETNTQKKPLESTNVDLSEISPVSKGVAGRIPILANIAEGAPIETVAEMLEIEEVFPISRGDHFALRVTGDSMNPKISENDIVIAKKQADVESGELAVVIVGDEYATLKQVIKFEGGTSLVSFNNAYPPMSFTNEQIKTLPVTILGKVVEAVLKF